MDPFLVLHCFSSRPPSRVGSMSLTQCPEIRDMMTREASCVASRTSPLLSPNNVRSSGIVLKVSCQLRSGNTKYADEMMYGSARICSSAECFDHTSDAPNAFPSVKDSVLELHQSSVAGQTRINPLESEYGSLPRLKR